MQARRSCPLQYTVLPRSGLNPYGTDASFALRTQNRLLQQTSYLERLKTKTSSYPHSLKELDPSKYPQGRELKDP